MSTPAVSDDYPRLIAFLTHRSWQRAFAALCLCLLLFYSVSYYVYGWSDGVETRVEGDRRVVHRVRAGSGGEAAGVQVGDAVLAIEGRLVQEWGRRPFTRPGMGPGDRLHYRLQRGDRTLTVAVGLGSLLEDVPRMVNLLAMHLLSAGFWVIGLLLTGFVPADDVRARLVGLVWLLAGVAMAAGGPGMESSSWGAYGVLQAAWCGLAFLLLASHLYFPAPSLPALRRWIVYGAAAVALALSAALVLHEWFLRPYVFQPWGVRIQVAVFWFFLLSALASVGLLVRHHFFYGAPDVRRQTGILLWGTALAFGPFLLLTLLPILLFDRAFIPGDLTVLFFAPVPLAYAYTIHQRRLLRVDFALNRILVAAITFLLLFSVSVLLLGTVAWALDFADEVPLVGGAIVSLVTLPTAGLRSAVQAGVDRVLYGYHYDFSSVTVSFSGRLARALDREELTTLLVADLIRQMAIKRAALFLAEGEALVAQGGDLEGRPLALDSELCWWLLAAGAPTRAGRLRERFPNERPFWERFDWVRLFVPLVFEGRLDGLLMLGTRAAGDVYSDQDVQILATVAQQGALAHANVRLVERLRGLTQRLVRADEAQRKHMARELHDTALQQLFFVKQTLLRGQGDPDLVALLDQTIGTLRQTIQTQRPPLLDQGLRLALQSLVKETRAMAGATPVIAWECDVAGRLALTDEQATALYRIAQEALANALKHARAQRVTVTLAADGGSVALRVADDGVGMDRSAAGRGAQERRYGLMGMAERAAMIDARLEVRSTPGQGTAVVVEVAG